MLQDDEFGGGAQLLSESEGEDAAVGTFGDFGAAGAADEGSDDAGGDDGGSEELSGAQSDEEVQEGEDGLLEVERKAARTAIKRAREEADAAAELEDAVGAEGDEAAEEDLRENLQEPIDVKAQGERVKRLAALLEGAGKGKGKRSAPVEAEVEAEAEEGEGAEGEGAEGEGEGAAGKKPSRKELMKAFQSAAAEYYGYNAFLIEKFTELFPVGEVRSLAPSAPPPLCSSAVHTCLGPC